MATPAARIKAQLAYGSRRDAGYSQERLAELRRDYYAARLADDIRNTAQKSGPFTAEQSNELKHLITETTAPPAAGRPTSSHGPQATPD